MVNDITDIPLEWIKGAGHNSNTDEPDVINRLIENVADKIQSEIRLSDL